MSNSTIFPGWLRGVMHLRFGVIGYPGRQRLFGGFLGGCSAGGTEGAGEGAGDFGLCHILLELFSSWNKPATAYGTSLFVMIASRTGDAHSHPGGSERHDCTLCGRGLKVEEVDC